MGKSKVTIKEIADMAGVSIATVSHVINRTRYVRPELVDKIEKIIVETGYQNKIADKERKLLVGRESTIVAVIPNCPCQPPIPAKETDRGGQTDCDFSQFQACKNNSFYV